LTRRRKGSARVVRTGKGARLPSHARVVRGYAAITVITKSGVDPVETQSTRGYAIVGSKMVRSRGLQPPHSYGYMHLKRARPPIPPRPLKPTASDPISSNTYLKLVGMPLSTWAPLASVFIPRIEGLRSALSLRSRLPECVRLQGSSDRVARVWHTIGTHLPQGWGVDALEDLD
jgi:hypothetical protein